MTAPAWTLAAGLAGAEFRAMTEALGTLGAQAHTCAAGPFRIAALVDDQTAERIRDYAGSFWEAMKPYYAEPAGPMTIYVFETKDRAAEHLEALFGAGRKVGSAMGGYDRMRRTGFCSMQWGLGWLGNMFLRGLLHDDWREVKGRPARWFPSAWESMLYNSYRTATGAFKGLNVMSYYRPQVQRMLEAGAVPALRDVFRHEGPGAALGDDEYRMIGREFLAYLFSRGRLVEFYKEFRRTWEEDPSGVLAAERVTNRKIGELDAAWRAWMLSADGEIGSSAMGAPFPILGILFARPAREDGQGVNVIEVCPGGPGERAGLRAGDVITGLGDQVVARAADLLALLKKQKIGAEVRLKLRRGGKPAELPATLDRFIDG